jgi:hydrogenase-4 component E
MSYEFASSAIDLLSIAMLVAALGIVWTRSLGWALVTFGAQSLMLSAAALYAGLATGSPHIIAGAGLTFVVKVIVTPVLLWLLLQRLPTSHDAQPSVGQRTGVVIAFVIAVVFGRALNTQPFHTAIGAERVLPTAVTVMLIGIQIMVTHRQALSQVIGFLVLENGMALAALTATYGMPLVVEFGIFLDLLLAVFVAFVYTQRMHVIFGSLDTERLRSLRG